MAFPTRRSRSIVVEGVAYRYLARFCERDRIPALGDVHEVRVQLADGPRQVLRAEFGYARLKREYARVGKHVSRWIDTLPPYVVRAVILLGLAGGWRPDEDGAELDLGLIDERIDWSQLSADA